MRPLVVSLLALLLSTPASLWAEKITLAHVAINPGQGVLWVAREAGLLAKYGLTGEVVLIPGSPRTVQALIAGDLDYAIAGTPALLRARMQGGGVLILSALSNYSSQRVLVKPDSAAQSLKEFKGKTIGVTQFGSAGDTFIRVALKTVTRGDPTYAGPLAGVELGLKAFHIFEPEMKASIDPERYAELIGTLELGFDSEAIVEVLGKARGIERR